MELRNGENHGSRHRCNYSLQIFVPDTFPRLYIRLYYFTFCEIFLGYSCNYIVSERAAAAFSHAATEAKSNVRFLTLNCRAETLERGGCGGLGAVGQTATAIALGADGELQRGWRDAGLPHGGGILPESSSGECDFRFTRSKMDRGRSEIM